MSRSEESITSVNQNVHIQPQNQHQKALSYNNVAVNEIINMGDSPTQKATNKNRFTKYESRSKNISGSSSCNNDDGTFGIFKKSERNLSMFASNPDSHFGNQTQREFRHSSSMNRYGLLIKLFKNLFLS